MTLEEYVHEYQYQYPNTVLVLLHPYLQEMTFTKMSIFRLYYLSHTDHSGGQTVLFENTFGRLQLHEDNSIE